MKANEEVISNDTYIAYTDGSYKSSIDCGGYSSIITQNDEVIIKLYQGFQHTTNNRMELMGVLETLKHFKTPISILIYSDSMYVVGSINQGHVFKWFKDKDMTKKNLDLWSQVIDLLKFHKVELKWVKGHNDNEMNELSNLYAQHASDCINLPLDIGYNSKFVFTNNK